jgi:hypothetical protein
MKIVLDDNPDVAINELYDTLKCGLEQNYFKIEHLESLSERIVELISRTKEADGESQG